MIACDIDRPGARGVGTAGPKKIPDSQDAGYKLTGCVHVHAGSKKKHRQQAVQIRADSERKTACRQAESDIVTGAPALQRFAALQGSPDELTTKNSLVEIANYLTAAQVEEAIELFTPQERRVWQLQHKKPGKEDYE